MDRYARQRLLAALGDRGQERIARTTFVVSSEPSFAAEVEREYLIRAGAQQFAAPAAARTPFAHAAAFKHESAREFAEGAWHALAQLSRILEHSP
jgi:hypothetical protein